MNPEAPNPCPKFAGKSREIQEPNRVELSNTGKEALKIPSVKVAEIRRELGNTEESSTI